MAFRPSHYGSYTASDEQPDSLCPYRNGTIDCAMEFGFKTEPLRPRYPRLIHTPHALSLPPLLSCGLWPCGLFGDSISQSKKLTTTFKAKVY